MPWTRSFAGLKRRGAAWYDSVMEMPRLKVSERMRSMMTYRKLAGNRPRILVLESQYWLDGACMNAARAMGWEVERAPVVMAGQMPREHVAGVLHKLADFRPDFVLSVNISGMDFDGMFARLFEDLRVPFVTWFVDDPRTILMGRTCYATPYTVVLTWDKAYEPYLRGVGFEVVCSVPLGVDTTLFDAEPPDEWDLPPTFVGNSMTQFAREEWAWVEQYPDLARGIRESFEGGRVNRVTFGQGLEALLGKDATKQLDMDQARHAEMVFFIEGTRRLRHALVERMAPEGVYVRGDEWWRELTPAAGGPLGYVNELADYYRRCPVSLNTTSIQMPNTVNQRVFDCPAAGGFLLTDAQPDLAELFDVTEEAACYTSLDECSEMFGYYRDHPAVRKEMAAKARKRVLGEHTYQHRLRQIAALVKERFG